MRRRPLRPRPVPRAPRRRAGKARPPARGQRLEARRGARHGGTGGRTVGRRPVSNERPPGRDPAATLRTALGAAGIQVVASLPDSWLSPLLTALDADPRIRHVKVTREDDALGIAAGAALAGGLGAVVCQNAGLLVGANALAGYVHLHELPLLVLAAQRGDVDDGFYYQAYKGRVVPPVLDAIGVPYHRVRGGADPRLVTAAAGQARLHRRPVVLLLDRESLLGEDAR
ncbi:hypothetical protein E1289_01120 [Actinomadura sp. 6K520]|nr:hypothetical protein E1289_01120 [Actinomadura sp. 6K520]